MKKLSKVFILILLLSLVLATGIIAFTACNNQNDPLIPTEHFDGDCLNKGFTRYYLSNGSYIDRPDENFGEHAYEKQTISTVSCTTDGVVRYTCKVCHNKYDDTTPKLNHKYTVTDSKKADCTTDGFTSYKCENCNDTYTDNEKKKDHSYELTDSKKPTDEEDGYKEYTCKTCKNSYTDIVLSSAHNFVGKVVEEATCTKEGLMLLHCDHCGNDRNESIPIIPHTPDTKVLNDSENHWHLCKYCQAVCESEKHTITTTNVPATCIVKAYVHSECKDCNYYINVTDENSVLIAHDYEAFTCKVCQRDEMLQYVNEFNSKGSSTNHIKATSENMFVLFFDFLILNRITEYKYIETTYISLNTNNVNDYISQVKCNVTATNWPLEISYKYNTYTKDITSIFARVANSGLYKLSETATITPDDYDSEAHKQLESFQFVQNAHSRAANFDNFAYKNRRYALNVTTSDDLFYAFEHGYQPNLSIGSAAERMLNKAKTVSRRIINDDMTDLQKVKAIYSYLVSDVQYDYGGVKETNNGTAFTKYTSYYLEGVFDHGIAVCDGISKAFCVLAGIENIKCVRVISKDHAWNKFYIDINGDGQKEWYGADATWGNQRIKFNNKSSEYLSVDDFLFTDVQKILARQTALNYKDITASDEANPYEHFYFGNGTTADNDYVIDSNTEMVNLITCLKNNFNSYVRGDIVTVELFVNLDFCTDKFEVEAAIDSAITKAWILGTTYSINVDSSPKTYGDTMGYVVTLFFPKS